MKKILLVITCAFTFTTAANAQTQAENTNTTQGIDPTLISDLCCVTYANLDSLGFHWVAIYQKATSPTVQYYTLETYDGVNTSQQGFNTAQDFSVFMLDTVLWDSTTLMRVLSYDVSQNLIFQTVPHKPIFIDDVQESNTHAVVFFSQYVGYTPDYYVIYRGTSMLNLAAYDSVGTGTGNQQYFDPEADTYGNYFYQVKAIRSTPCDASKANAWSEVSSGARSDIRFATTTGVNENTALLNSITLYPNPGQNNVTVNLGKQATGAVTVNVLNTMGQLMKTTTITKDAGQNLTVDIAALPAGIYFLQVQAFGGVKTLRVVKN